jgi:hypothetical protein
MLWVTVSTKYSRYGAARTIKNYNRASDEGKITAIVHVAKKLSHGMFTRHPNRALLPRCFTTRGGHGYLRFSKIGDIKPSSSAHFNAGRPFYVKLLTIPR